MITVYMRKSKAKRSMKGAGKRVIEKSLALPCTCSFKKKLLNHLNVSYYNKEG